VNVSKTDRHAHVGTKNLLQLKKTGFPLREKSHCQIEQKNLKPGHFCMNIFYVIRLESLVVLVGENELVISHFIASFNQL